MRKFKCGYCGIEFNEKEFDIGCGIETVISCPNGCIIGSVYIPNICEVKEL